MAFDVGSAVAKIKADLSNFKQGMAEARAEADGLGNTMGRVGAGVADFGKQAAVFTGVVAGALGLAGKIGLDTAGKFEQYQIAFGTLLKSEKAASEAILQIQKDAAETPFEMQPLIMGNQRLISAGVSAKQARVDIINLGNAISATGGGNAELERLSTNLQQIKAVGKASALDIKQFAFAGINVYQMLADSMGKNVAEIKEMDISYDDLTKAFAKAGQKGGMFEDAMKKQSTTLNGLISTLKDTVTIGLKDILMESGIFDALRSAAASAIPFLQNVAVPALVNFGKAIGTVVMLIRDAFSADFDIGAWLSEEDYQKFLPFIEILRNFQGVLSSVAAWIANNQELVFTFLKGLAVAVGALLVIGTVTAMIMALTNPLVLVALAIAALFTAYQTNFLGIRDITNAVVSALADVFNNILMPLISMLVAWITANWTNISNITSGIWKIITGIIQVAWNLIYGIFAVGLALLQGDWKKAWEIVKQTLSGAWDGIKTIFSGAIDFIKGWGGMMLGELVRPFQDAWNKISELVNKIKDALDFTKRHSPSVVDIVQKGVRLVNRAFDDLPINMLNITPATGMGAAMLGGGTNGGLTNLTLQINMDGAIISDDFGAQRIAEKVGDSIVKKLQQNIRF